MKREGSPWTGLWAVVLKEMADHLSSIRMQLLELLMLLTAIGTVYAAIQTLRQTVGEDPFLFLRLYTTVIDRDRLPYSFISFLAFLVPLAAIALGFDAVNGEHNRRTLSRVLSQPIYRDALLLGKFLAGLLTLAIIMLALWLLVSGLGIFRLGVAPTGEEVGRGLLFLLATVLFAGIWLAVAMCFSVIFRQPSTSALASIATWLFFQVFWDILVGIFAALVPGQSVEAENFRVQFQFFLSRVSPNTLYGDMLAAFLDPTTRFVGLVSLEQIVQLRQAGILTPLPLFQSLMLVWPQLTGMTAALLILFAVAYTNFQRQEVRA